MSVQTVILKISEEVTNGQEVCATYIPPAGAKKIILGLFNGDAAFTENSVIRVTWDHGEAGETTKWSTKGNEEINLGEEITGYDGTKKIGLCCGNGEANPIYMAAKLKIKVYT